MWTSSTRLWNALECDKLGNVPDLESEVTRQIDGISHMDEAVVVFKWNSPGSFLNDFVVLVQNECKVLF